MQTEGTNFTKGAIAGPLFRFALPVLLALLLQTAYGAVDLMVVGQFAAAGDTSAVSTGSQVMQTITVTITGLAMGLTILLGQKIGQGSAREAGRVMGAGIWLFLVIGVIVTVTATLGARPLSVVMHAPPEALEQTVSYVAICSAGTVFIVAYNLIGSIFRGIGDAKLPLITVGIACVINIAGDLLLVAVFGLGAVGAAIATVAAQAVSSLLSLLIIHRRTLPFEFTKKDVRPDSRWVKAIFRLGVPCALQDLLASISFLVILAIVNGLGVIASAGVGVAERLCGFLMLVPSAYMQSMSAFVAQNIGAAEFVRARKALFIGVGTAVVVGIAMFVLAYFDGIALTRIFVSDNEVALAGADYLKAYAIDCLLTCFLFCYIGYFNGCGSTTFVMIQGLIGALALRLPLSWLFSRIEPVSLFRIGLAIPIATVVQITLCFVYYAVLRRRQDRLAVQTAELA
ncbi:MAG: MATE family efflux transporter [Clostridia bacterium]|nr:MATE family efflux transporter [Clostridia bacterium]